jgi:hypothetical protein
MAVSRINLVLIPVVAAIASVGAAAKTACSVKDGNEAVVGTPSYSLVSYLHSEVERRYYFLVDDDDMAGGTWQGLGWDQAAGCAQEAGGYLVHIDDATEQAGIEGILGLSGTPLLDPGATTAGADGFNRGFIWIGATDAGEEGSWRWNGDNDDATPNKELGDGQGWLGGDNWTTAVEAYANWGGTALGYATPNEPDNFPGVQNAAALALEPWPVYGSYGVAGEWNDLNADNTLYFLVEFDDNDNGVGDGMGDGWERHYGLDPAGDDSGADPDDDNLPNVEEHLRGTDPTVASTDGDSYNDDVDNCPLVANDDQLDTDDDGLGDVCDPDKDGDGVVNEGDNCPLVVNVDQLDTDNDGLGDACDADKDGDGMPNDWEENNGLDPLVDDANSDADGDGASNLIEYQNGTDPQDPTSYPKDPKVFLPILNSILLGD